LVLIIVTAMFKKVLIFPPSKMDLTLYNVALMNSDKRDAVKYLNFLSLSIKLSILKSEVAAYTLDTKFRSLFITT